MTGVPSAGGRTDGHTPNSIPVKERVTNTVASLVVLGYGAYGTWVDDLYVPGRRRTGIHLHGTAAWIMYAAMICASLVMLSVVADHYDRRPNEGRYRAFARVWKGIGWGLFAASILWAAFA